MVKGGIKEFSPNYFTATHWIARSELPVSVISIYIISKNTRKTRFTPSMNS
jgi:hypothetical protein